MGEFAARLPHLAVKLPDMGHPSLSVLSFFILDLIL